MSPSFARRVHDGEQLLGALVRMPNEGLVELAGLVGLDFVVIDVEHGPGDQLALAQHLTAAAANGLATLVRIGQPEETLRVLDLGADGIVAPHVSSVAQAAALVATAHYPPRGHRGFAGYSRAGQYGITPPAEHHARGRDTLVIAMIEDELGLSAAGAIADVDGIDGLLFGPADFAAELGLLAAPGDPRIAAGERAVRDDARAAGVAPLAIVGSPARAREAFAAGSTMVVYNVAHALGELFTGLASARPGSTPPHVGSAPAGPTAGVGMAPPRPGPGSWPSPSSSAPSGGREPLVLLPGMLGDAMVWDAVAADLADVATPHFARIDLDDSLPEMAASVLAAAPPRFALAGHSLGAIVALEIARQAPERITRLALVNASGRGPSDTQQASWAATLARLDRGEFAHVAGELSRLTLPAAARADPRLVAANERMAVNVGETGLRRQLRAQQARTSYLDGLGAIAVPVLVVSAALDDICPPARQHEIVAHCPRARLVELPDAGHLAPLERPAALAGHLRGWLAES